MYATLTSGATSATPTTPAAPAAVLPPPRRVIFYIDNLSLAAADRNHLVTEMKKFVAQSMRPRDEAMVATFNRVLRIPLPFTDDRAAIEAAFDRITTEAASGDTRRREAMLAQQDIHASGQHQQR